PRSTMKRFLGRLIFVLALMATWSGCSGTGTGGAGGGAPCSAPEDCPLPANECTTRTCDGGMCGTRSVAHGTPLTAQTAGDCRQDQCNGVGGVVSVADDTDTPADDNNVCTGEVCSAGMP